MTPRRQRGHIIHSRLAALVSADPDARKRVRALRRALAGSSRCTFLVQNDPDPDAIGSALALRRTLGLSAARSPIVTAEQITRPENQRLIAELREHVRHVSTERLPLLAPLILVDVQPPYFGNGLQGVAAVIDHHPTTGAYSARFRDVRTSYGASATMAAEYLLASNVDGVTTKLATALLYGIITDTKSLSRAASDEDLQMFALLFQRADHVALRRIQHPSYRPLALRRFGVALEHARVRNGLAYLHLGLLPADQEHIVAQLAEFCLGMAGAEISAVSGVFGGKFAMSLRSLSPHAKLGERIRRRFSAFGSAGGHPMMAKTVVPLVEWRKAHPFTSQEGLGRTIRRELVKALNESK